MSSPRPNQRVPHVRRSFLASTVGLLTLLTLSAHATLPPWLQHVVGASSIESALYRTMSLPSVQALYPRPPKESQTAIAALIASTPNDAELYALRAHADEDALDFAAAEADWKLFVAHAQDAANANLQLADFYQRRLLIPQELAVLNEVAAAPPIAAERFVDPAHQRSWLCFERMLALIADQALSAAQTSATYQVFLTRYPAEPAVYARFFNWQLTQQDWPGAEALIARYRQTFTEDGTFAIRAQALLDYRRGNIDQALAVYDRSFQPLWPAELVHSYFALLDASHRQRAFVADARAQLAAHPDGPEALNALARIFFYDQQAGRLDKANATLDSFRAAREARSGAWPAQDLYTLAALSAATHNYAEAARYDYALASTPGTLPAGESAAQAGLAALVDLLLTAPDQPLAIGAGNLSLYRDIATLDQGPGYWNGILSLWLNGTSPESEYAAETAKSQSYFHRAKAAELLGQLDQKFSAAPERESLHAAIIRAYAGYGEPDAVIDAGKQFLTAFPASPVRYEIAGLIADAYARQQNTAAEFALYDSLLAELASKTDGLPLTSGTLAQPIAQLGAPFPIAILNPAKSAAPDSDENPSRAAGAMKSINAGLLSYAPTSPLAPYAGQYGSILDRYLGRLAAQKQVPQALAVLRHQLDLYPNEPLLYERLATFLEQNSLTEQQEQTYKLALARFQQPGWYDKLARLYLRERNREAYVALTHQVSDIFSGTDLDRWFAQSSNLGTFNTPTQPALGAQLAVQLNLYAQKRFPHDLVFTRNLLRAYDTRPTQDRAAYEALLRRHWWEADDLRQEFFAYLARTNKLQAELNALGSADSNPAATRELAEIDIWNSHFEAAAPLMGSVAALYPAETTPGDQAISLFRSLAYLDPTPASTNRAVTLEKNLIAADPLDANRLATLGDLYAEATSIGGEDIAAAAPYWRRIPTLHPGTPAGYLTSATIFWDYFQFDSALAELTQARTRFHQPTLFGYEAGAIAENRGDLPTAVAEYTAVATHPPADTYFLDGLNAAVGALVQPPSDAADSNLWSTAQSLFNASDARGRLLQLATRPAAKAIVDKGTAQAVAAAPTPAALTLRADVLIAQHRQPEIAPLLEAALTRASTAEGTAAIGDLARTHSDSAPAGEAALQQVSVALPSGEIARNYAPSGSYALTSVYEHALEKQIALTADPVEKIQLSYTLATSLESHKDIPAATRIVDAVYKANPRILGVVRATTDFYARTNQPPRAIATLLEAAKAATPGLARSFTLEAAQRANDAGDTRQARALAEPLRTATPYDAQVLAILAASYARANDDAGLKAFYLAELASVKTAALSPSERKADTALLRRGLIPALTRLKDYPGALDQYIALLSAYPEDSNTAQEAALYALANGRQDQLLAFLNTTVKQSPNDSRFAILLAQVETTFDDLPAAVHAYDLAIAIRKDRADLYSARVDLELRLGLGDPALNDQAATDFNRLYLLSYNDPSWMVRLAELRARQQRPADAVKALETAYITGQPPSAANQFRVADQLAQWNLLAEARTCAERGIALAGPDLLGGSDATGAASYARILTRLGKPDEALARLNSAYALATRDRPLPSEMVAGYAALGVSPSDIARDARSWNDNRRQMARQQLDQAVNAIGQVVQTYYTPEQKLAYAQALDQVHNTSATLALTAATDAGLNDREAEWRKQLLLTTPLNSKSPPDASAYVELERRRGAFAELAPTLEAFAARIAPSLRGNILQQAAQAYRDAGDEANEIRVTRPLVLAHNDALRDRFLDLLLRRDRNALIALAANSDDTLGDAAANYAVAHATQAQALAAVNNRARNRDAVWGPATASLVLTNFAAPSTTTAPTMLSYFAQSLRFDDTIAARLGNKADPRRQLTGPNWFYYGSRFGLFLATVPKAATLPDAEDFLPAELEEAPTTPAAYLHLARNFAEEADYAASATEYTHALKLAPNNPAVHDEYAVVLDRAHHRDEALAQWRAALALLAKRQSGEEFFSALKSVVFHLGQRSLVGTLRPELDSVLRPYLARNGNYRSDELLHAIYAASPTPAQGTSFVLAAAGYAANPNLILEDLDRAPWLAASSRESLLLRRLEVVRNDPIAAPDTIALNVRAVQTSLLELYLDRNELAKAEALFASMPPLEAGKADSSDRVILAVRTGHLAPLLTAWRNQPDTIPTNDQFNAILYRLRRATPAYTPDEAAIQPLQEFVFTRKQLSHALVPTDFLALAQSRIATGNLPGALDLLHRLTLQPTSSYENGFISFPGSRPTPVEEESYDNSPSISYHEPPAGITLYANTDYAAALLESTKHYAEAVPFLTTLVQSVPWNASFRLRLAEAELKAGDSAKASELFVAASDASAAYGLRVKAAADLATLPAPSTPYNLGGREVTLLASTAQPTPAAVRQPYFVAARILAGSAPGTSKPDRIALLREALAITPTGSTADRARLDLLLTQTATDSASAILALYGPLSNMQPSYNFHRREDAEADTGEAEADSEPGANALTQSPEDPVDGQRLSNGPDPTFFPFHLAVTLDRPTQIRLAVLLASAYNREHNPAMSLFYDKLAVNLDARNPKRDPVVVKRLTDFEATLAIEKKNALRRPLIHADLDQAVQVRPRLTLAGQARAEAP